MIVHKTAFLTRINNIFRSVADNGDYLQYGIYPAPAKFRETSDHVSEPPDVNLSPEEIEEQKKVRAEKLAQVEAEKKRKDEEKAKAAALAAAREQNIVLVREITGGADRCNPEQASTLARKLGFTPSMQEIMEVEAAYPNGMDYDEILKHFQRIELEEHQDKPEDLEEYFRQFDKLNEGSVSSQQLLNILTSYGETLTKEEALEVIKMCGFSGQDRIDYKEFIKQLMSDE